MEKTASKIKIQRRKMHIIFNDGQEWGPHEIDGILPLMDGLLVVKLFDDNTEGNRSERCIGFGVHNIASFEEYKELE